MERKGRGRSEEEGLGWRGERKGVGEESRGDGVERREGGGSEEGGDPETELEGPRDARETRGAEAEAEAGLPAAGWGAMGWGKRAGGAVTHRAR